jgi:hypothetical protein
MGRRRGVMSEELKYELAKDLGFYETVMREGWEGIRTKDAGNMVRRAIQIAEEKLARDYRQQQQPQRGQQQAYRGAGQLWQQPQQPYGGQPNVQPYQQPNQQAYQPLPRQPMYGNSRQSGFTPAYPPYPGFPPQAEPGGAASPYPN